MIAIDLFAQGSPAFTSDPFNLAALSSTGLIGACELSTPLSAAPWMLSKSFWSLPTTLSFFADASFYTCDACADKST